MTTKPEKLIKDARERMRLTQAEVAEKSGVSPRFYQRMEGGTFPKFKSETVRAIDRILGTKVYELLYDTKIPTASSESEEIVDSAEPGPETINLEKAILNLSESDKVNARNIERLINLLEIKFGVSSSQKYLELPNPGDPGTIPIKKANEKAGHGKRAGK
jgi:transcriptional regulator with XRE-family HTH domain